MLLTTKPGTTFGRFSLAGELIVLSCVFVVLRAYRVILCIERNHFIIFVHFTTLVYVTLLQLRNSTFYDSYICASYNSLWNKHPEYSIVSSSTLHSFQMVITQLYLNLELSWRAQCRGSRSGEFKTHRTIICHVLVTHFCHSCVYRRRQY